MSDTTSRPITLELTNVTVRFGGLLALHDVSFRVYENEIVGLIGPNGAGKTTAFNVACGFQKPTSGSVHFPASGHGALRPSQLAKAGVARTLQGVGLFPNLALGFRVQKPPSGSVHFPASGHGALRPSQLAKAGVARTLQGVGLFPHLSVLENVMAGAQSRFGDGFFTSVLGLPRGLRIERSLREEAFGELERLEIAKFARALPGGIP